MPSLPIYYADLNRFRVPGAPEKLTEVLKRLAEVEKNLAETQKEAAALLIAILKNTVGARYHASLATTYADDMITMMQTGNVLSEQEAERRQAVREKEAQPIEAATVAQAVGAKDKGGRKVN